MVSYGRREGARETSGLYLDDWAVYFARKHGLPEPTEEKARRRGPLAAVAKSALELLDRTNPEPIEECMRRLLRYHSKCS